MANQRKGYTDFKGNVEYGGIDAKTFSKLYRGEAVYNSEGITTPELNLPSCPLTNMFVRRHTFPDINSRSNAGFRSRY